jgi:hypothetical protein
MQLKIETRDPQHLKQLQPALKLVPELPDDSEEFLALAAGIKKAGFIRPILIDEDGRIIDDHSRNQARVARRWQLKEAPVQVCRSEDAALLRIHSLCHVRHLSKGAQIYLCVDDALEMIEQSKRDVIAWHKSQRPEGAGSVRPEGGRAPEVLTQDEICEMFKWAKRMFERAIEVKKIFQDGRKYSWNVTGGAADGEVFEGTAREWFLPKLVQAFTGGEHEDARPIGLGGIIAGYETKRKNPDPDKFNPRHADQLELFVGAFGSKAVRQFRAWNAMSADKKRVAREQIEAEAEKMRPQDAEAAAVMFAEIARIYKDAGRAKAV